MKGISYRDRDHSFGKAMLALRTKMGLTQVELAQSLEVSRRAVGDWEAGKSYPKPDHFKQLVVLALEHKAFPAGSEAETIRALWHASHQKVLREEAWLNELLRFSPKQKTNSAKDEESRIRNAEYASLVLPFQPTLFVGREAELTEIDALLEDPACRLLSLVGPGGIGKTRLAFEVATLQTKRFLDGVVFVALFSVGTPNQIVSAIGSDLHLSFSSDSDARQQLLEYLQTRQILLLLDNFEHLLDGAELIAEILSAAPGVKILVTSRERLNLSAEWLFEVGGLAYPSGDERTRVGPNDPTGMAGYSAVQLFIQRATQVKPSFALSDPTYAPIVSICQHVNGMPLAIELAVANIRTLPVSNIEQQIRSNLDSLTSTLRDLPPRHRSLRAVFNHSWNLLNEPERSLFSKLAIFRGSCTLAAAKEVAGATLPDLTALINKSLVQVAEPGAVSEPRFLLLEPIREYALEKLAEQGEYDNLQYIHAGYFLALAEAAAAQWDSPAAHAGLEQLGREYNNIRAALEWSHASNHPVIGLRIAEALTRFWQLRGYISEGRVWLADLLALDDLQQDPRYMAARMRALNSAARLAADQHDFVHAAQMFKESTALRHAVGETRNEISLIVNAALEARAVGQYRQATTLLEEVLAQQRGMGDRGSVSTGGIGLTLYLLPLVLREQGEYDRAMALLQECMDLHQKIGEREGVAQALLGMSDVMRDRGEAARTRKYCEECLTIYQEFGTQWAIGFTLSNLALAAYLENDLKHAIDLVSESVTVFRIIKHDGGVAEALITLGNILRAQGEVAAADETLSEALQLALVVGPRLLVAAALEGLASVKAQSGHADLAIQLLSAASTLRSQMSTPVRPFELSILESTLATARTMLGDETFITIWDEAGKLPLEQILRNI